MSTIFENARSITMLPLATVAIAQYAAVEVIAAGTVQTAGAASESVVGLALESSPDSDVAGVDPKQAAAAISIAVLDGAKLVCLSGAAFAAGIALMTDSTGRLVTATTGLTIVAISLEAAGGRDRIRSARRGVRDDG